MFTRIWDLLKRCLHLFHRKRKAPWTNRTIVVLTGKAVGKHAEVVDYDEISGVITIDRPLDIRDGDSITYEFPPRYLKPRAADGHTPMMAEDQDGKEASDSGQQ